MYMLDATSVEGGWGELTLTFERYHRQNGKSNERCLPRLIGCRFIFLVKSDKQPAHYPSRTKGKIRHATIDERK